MRRSALALACALAALAGPSSAADDEQGWKPLFDGKPLDRSSWTHVGGGDVVYEDGVLRTANDAGGLGILLYTKEPLGDCQIRVVYRTKDAKDNAGVHVRIDPAGLDKLKAASDPDTEGGAWYAVHHGYEVQICDAGGDPFHRTGALYSLAQAAAVPERPSDAWKTMIITLDGDRVEVEVEGKRVTTFDPATSDIPPRRQWYEPKREPVRPRKGYIGLQNHDPGDDVYFREVSVRPLPSTR